MEPAKQKSSAFAGVMPAVDIEHPGFFPYARFSHSANKRKADIKPLSQNSEFAIWPTVIDSKTAGAGASRRK